jgi:hypothetical protein
MAWPPRRLGLAARRLPLERSKPAGEAESSSGSVRSYSTGSRKGSSRSGAGASFGWRTRRRPMPTWRAAGPPASCCSSHRFQARHRLRVPPAAWRDEHRGVRPSLPAFAAPFLHNQDPFLTLPVSNAAETWRAKRGQTGRWVLAHPSWPGTEQDRKVTGITAASGHGSPDSTLLMPSGASSRPRRVAGAAWP